MGTVRTFRTFSSVRGDSSNFSNFLLEFAESSKSSNRPLQLRIADAVGVADGGVGADDHVLGVARRTLTADQHDAHRALLEVRGLAGIVAHRLVARTRTIDGGAARRVDEVRA